MPSPSRTLSTEDRPAPPPIGGAEVVTSDGTQLPLVSAWLTAKAGGGLARCVLEQRYENRHTLPLHVTYRMPLPADAAISGFQFEVAGAVIAGKVTSKRDARDQFVRAILAGHTAALLEQDRGEIFTQQLGNLPAGEALIARITIDLPLTWLPEGEWELRFPTVIGPRYVADTDEPDPGVAIATRSEGVAARIRIAVAIADPLRGAPGSPSHALAFADGVAELREPAGAALDRDIVVRWPVAGAAVGATLQLATVGAPAGAYARDRADETYGLLTIVPPRRAERAQPVARDLIVLIDTSGSMDGPPLARAKQLVALLIDSLGERDRLELIEFSSEPRRWRSGPIPASREAKRRAVRWVEQLVARGGTEMRQAVLEAMHALRPDAQRQVVVVSDGYLAGEVEIVRTLRRALPTGCRLHFVGVGSAVNRGIARAMARVGRGAEVVCDLGEDAERAARRIIDRTHAPILTDVTLAGDALIAAGATQLPDVHEGAPLVTPVQLRAGELIVRGTTARGPWEHRLVVRPPEVGTGNAAIATLFGRERVAELEAGWVTHEPNERAIAVLGETFQIATRFTSWVAIDAREGIPGDAVHEVMPQALPFGTPAAAFGLRRDPPRTHAYTLGGSWDPYAQPTMQKSAGAGEFKTRVASIAPPKTLMAGPPSGPLGGPPGGRRSEPPSELASRSGDAMPPPSEPSTQGLGRVAPPEPVPGSPAPERAGRETAQLRFPRDGSPPRRSRRDVRRVRRRRFLMILLIALLLGALAWWLLA